MDKVEIRSFYKSTLTTFTNECERALSMSKVSSGLQAGDKRYWASVLFTRLCSSSISLLLLCPDSKLNPTGIHWDFSSIASLTRNLFEASLTFFYLGIEDTSEDEWITRIKVMQLHDCLSRLKMFRDFDSADPQLEGFQIQAEDLKTVLSQNTFFLSLPETKRRKFLRGEQSCILTQDEILERMGEQESQTRGYYRFLSSHIHSFPLSYYRMSENNIGRGIESPAEVGYSAGALEFATNILRKATEDMERIFSDLVTNPNETFKWSSLSLEL